MRISRRPYLKNLEVETVVVHTRDGVSISGVLLAAHSDVYVLRHAAYLNGDGSKVAIEIVADALNGLSLKVLSKVETPALSWKPSPIDGVFDTLKVDHLRVFR